MCHRVLAQVNGQKVHKKFMSQVHSECYSPRNSITVTTLIINTALFSDAWRQLLCACHLHCVEQHPGSIHGLRIHS